MDSGQESYSLSNLSTVGNGSSSIYANAAGALHGCAGLNSLILAFSYGVFTTPLSIVPYLWSLDVTWSNGLNNCGHL
eukprot:4220967-Ditylum_brightwellii.AAC.1